jgi:hypothetical protein
LEFNVKIELLFIGDVRIQIRFLELTEEEQKLEDLLVGPKLTDTIKNIYDSYFDGSNCILELTDIGLVNRDVFHDPHENVNP